MSKQAEPRSASSTSSGDVPLVPLGAVSDSPRSDEDDKNVFGVRGGSSLNKGVLSQGGSPNQNSRRRSVNSDSRPRFRVQIDSNSSLLSDTPQDSPNYSSQEAPSLDLISEASENVKVDTSFVNDTLQSINRLKEEKEFLLEDGSLKGGSLTAIVLRLIEDCGTSLFTYPLSSLPPYLILLVSALIFYSDTYPLYIHSTDRNAALSFLIVLPRYGLPEQLLGLLVDKYPSIDTLSPNFTSFI